MNTKMWKCATPVLGATLIMVLTMGADAPRSSQEWVGPEGSAPAGPVAAPSAEEVTTVAAADAPRGRAGSVAYVSGSSGEPWGMPGNVNALDDVFGPGAWTRLDFPTAVGNGLWSYDMIFMDGGDGTDAEFMAFVNANRADMENWVAAGGSLIINAGRYDSSDLDLGFGMILHSGSSDTGTADNTSHPVYDGPWGFTGDFFDGDYLAHDYVTGATSLMTGDVGYPILAEKDYGAGHVVAGGLTLPFFGEHELWSDNCATFHRNLLAYAYSLAGGGTGACCVEGECVATTTCDECTSMGGWWYEGETCPEFECPCHEALWHNGEPDFVNGLAAQRGPIDPIDAWVVDDVTFEEDIIVRDLHWWAVTDDAFAWQNTDDIIILASDGPNGGPGTVIVEMWDVYNIRYDTCRDAFSRNIYVYSIDGLEIPLAAGTYWIGMRPVNQGDSGQSYNMTSLSGDAVVQECYFQSEYFGYPDWTPGHVPFGEYHDIAFCVTGSGPDDAKYSQPINCEDQAYYSNLNSNWGSWKRFDDFVCTMTGEIRKVVFWGCMFPCGHLENLDAIQIDMYERLYDGPCDWQHGAPLCSNTIPLEDLEYVYECTGPNGEEYYRFTALLPEPCWQDEDFLYALRIAGILNNPDDDCIFAWAATSPSNFGLAYSFDEPDTWACGGPDNAFELYTEAGGDCIIDQNQPNAVTYMAAFSQTDLAQSFQQDHDSICGAGIHLYTVGNPGQVTISVWDALPDEGGTMLASGSDIGTPGNWIDVFWPTVSITAGRTYYLVFEDDNTGMGIYGDTSDPYPHGHVFANPGYDPFPDYDYTFRTYYETGAQNECPWDFDGNGVVNTADLLFLLGAWGTPDGDVNDDGTTNTADLLDLLGNWGDCP
ncbi:MAG: hypothetical protein SYC29_13475 [Planctomycetota bacterium]|nr:hypothetical protein [Planctomycetota bacterium]